MHRRTYLALAGVGTAALAGCSSSGGSSGQPKTSTSTSTPTATGTPTAEPASYELVEIDADERVEIGVPYGFAFTVRNTGGQDGTLQTPLSIRTADDAQEWYTYDEPLQLEVPAGETATWRSQEVPFDYLQEVDWRLDAFDATWTVQVVSRSLDWGRPYTTPDEISVIASGVDITREFEWSANGRDYIAEAPNGKTYGLLGIRAENLAGKAARAPRGSNFFLIKDDQQFNARSISTYPDQYRGGELQAGIVARGDVVFEIPAGTTEDELEAVYSSGTYAGDVSVYWGRE